MCCIENSERNDSGGVNKHSNAVQIAGVPFARFEVTQVCMRPIRLPSFVNSSATAGHSGLHLLDSFVLI